MKKLHCLLLAVISVLVFGFAFVNETKAATNIEITTNATEHTVVMPYEKSFRFVATIKNNSEQTKKVSAQLEGEMPKDGHLLAPTGQYELGPGQSARWVAVFEPKERFGDESGKEGGSDSQPGPPPGTGPDQGSKPKPEPDLQPESDQSSSTDSSTEVVTIPVNFSWEGGQEQVKVTVTTIALPFASKKDDLSEVKVSVLDENSGKAITGASVAALLPSGMEQTEASSKGKEYELSAPSGEFLQETYDKYQIDQTNQGYFFQVTAKGYQGYFESDYLPVDGEEKIVKLKPLEKVGEYSLQNSVESDFSIWWIRASDDNKYFAFSQGAHGLPGEPPPDTTNPTPRAVLLLDASGQKLWERETGGECWGLDISPDGKYVAAGCQDGNIQVWSKSGDDHWQFDNDKGNSVRWVKFSPDSKYLLAGPTYGTPEQSGLFEVESGKLLWSHFTGDWLREGRFSADGNTVYLDSANGLVHALETSTGELKWTGDGEHIIPFMLAISENTGVAIAAGKGRAFTALDLTDGQQKWQTTVDQTVTAAQTADDGSIVGATVGGMAYGLQPDGSFRWARAYGGVGHNGVHYTKNGQYSFLGGPNPTLLDDKGNVLWQREKGGRVQMSGVAERDESGNAVWVAEDASKLIVGQGDGTIELYEGVVKDGANDNSQAVGSRARESDVGFFEEDFELKEDLEEIVGEEGKSLIYLVGLLACGLAGLVTLVVIVVVLVKARKRIKKQKENGGDKSSK
ncbi:MAG: PQQ-binding-like beta-propeller repeat protein [Parcubacteria group bacterium]|nr:PQQ-binding-like beta-propeller repeat protein [Parcubacteria group bacterium]